MLKDVNTLILMDNGDVPPKTRARRADNNRVKSKCVYAKERNKKRTKPKVVPTTSATRSVDIEEADFELLLIQERLSLFGAKFCLFDIVIRMTEYIVGHLKLQDRNKTLEAKVYRKLLARNAPKPMPIGNAIQTNINVSDVEYFNQILEIGSAYRVYDLAMNQQAHGSILLKTKQVSDLGDTLNLKPYQRLAFQIISLTLLYWLCSTVGDLAILEDPNRRHTIRRKVDIENQDGIIIKFTMWGDVALEFDKELVEIMEGPKIIVVSSCHVSWYRVVCLSCHSLYLNPNIPNTELSRAEYKKNPNRSPLLEVCKHWFEDPDKERLQNRYSLALFLHQNQEAYMGAGSRVQ
ncbi:nucleic acid-binding, OB-fold protein [Tanacetum coccineum]